jgi:PGF-pre-PGF domain-containing protein
MTERKHLALLCAVAIIGLLISPVSAIEAAPGDHIYRGFDRAQNHPDIDGNTIVWEDDRNGNKDIYLGTIDQFRSQPSGYTGERITSDPASQERPSISGNYIVWQDDRNGNWDIYLYDRSTSVETQLTNDTGKQWLPAVHGNYVAWYDDSNGATNIVVYDIAEGAVIDVIERDARTTIPFSAVATEFRPALSEKYVAWVDDTDGERIWYYDLAAGEIVGAVTTLQAFQSWPSLSGSLIAWEDYRHGSGNPEIYMTDLDNPSGGEQRITNDSGYQVSPSISENFIAWEDMRDGGRRSIYMYDLARGEEMSVFVPEDIYDEQLYPAASGNTIVWQRGMSPNSNLYIFVYDPAAAPVDPVPTTIEITPPTATLAVGATQAFEATVLDQDENEMTGVAVTWTSSNETVGTIDTDGLFTAIAEGTAPVTATVENITATATVTVNGETPADPVATRIEIMPPAVTVEVNETVEFSATVFDQFGSAMTGVEIAWTSSDEAIGTIDANGTFTALAAGTADVTATAGNVTGSATVTVEAPAEPVLDSIQITPTGATIVIGDTQRFIVTARDQDGNVMSGVAVNWTSSDETVGAIDADGIFSALAEGTATVTATVENITATANVTVNNGEPALASIVVVPSAITLGSGETQQFTATAFDQFGAEMTGVEIAWTSSDEAVGTIDADGLFSALADGTATVTATAESVNGTAEVTVTTLSSGVVVSPSMITLDVGGSRQFTATVYDPEGNETPDAVVTWTISDEAVGTIDADGLFSALAEGTATITATAENETGTATVTVELPPAPTRIEIEPATDTVLPGDTRQFTATVFDQRDNRMDWISVAWSSSNPDVGSIDRAGLFAAFAEGTTDVTASAGDAEATAAVTVAAGAVPEPTPTQGSPGSSGGGGGGGASNAPTFSAGIRENLRSGETFTYSEISVSSVSSVAVTAAETVPKLMVTVKEASRPAAAQPPVGEVYEYISITLNWANPQSISNGTILFNVPADWLEARNATAGDVRLMRYADGGWQILDTTALGQENGNYRFQATTPGFSIFAITVAPVSVTPAGETNSTTTGEETNTTIGEETNVTVNETANMTTEATTAPTTASAMAQSAPLVYAPLLAPLAFLLWARRKH